MKRPALILGILHQTTTLVVHTNALPQQRRIPDILAQIKLQREEQLLLTLQQQDERNPSTSDVETGFFDQTLDHFSTSDPVDERTFNQRYFYTRRYVQTSDEADSNQEQRQTAAFLCVGGEGPSMDATVLTNSVHCTGDMIALADKLYHDFNWDVHLFAIEHRYYGKSVPTIEETNDGEASGYLRGDNDSNSQHGNQKDGTAAGAEFAYLSSRQAVKDIVEFVSSIEITTDSDKKVPWITFGGSYPGMLAAWSRLLHPDVIHGAVSNSAPVEAKLDFNEYNDRVGFDLADEFVGGSEECRRIVLEGHEEVVDIFDRVVVGDDNDNDPGGNTADELNHVATLFNVCGGADMLRADKNNMDSFVGDGLFNIPAQENDPSCQGEVSYEEKVCNIRGICDKIVHEHTSDPNQSSMEILAKVSKLQSDSCVDVNYKDYVDYFSTPKSSNANARAWFYQTCTEFGFYQTCNVDSNCPYGKGHHDVSRDLEACGTWFGIKSDDAVAKNVQSTLDYYGGWNLTPQAEESLDTDELGINAVVNLQGQKRIIFVTGDVDPWTELAVTGDKGNKDHPTYSVKGASHHFWTHMIKDTDGDEIVAARKIIQDKVFEWLWSTNSSFHSLDGEATSVA